MPRTFFSYQGLHEFETSPVLEKYTGGQKKKRSKDGGIAGIVCTA